MSYLSPEAYLPHEAPMMLLGSVENVSDDTAVCRVAVNGQSVLAPFLNADGDLPGWYALELMAQTVGVWSGWHRQQQGRIISRWAWCSARASWFAPAGISPQA